MGNPRLLTNCYFNPRSPWGERLAMQAVWDWEHEFQSTLPVGGATSELPPGLLHHLHFNPRSPWGERRTDRLRQQVAFNISIHAPRGGATRLRHLRPGLHPNFNPRSPWGERLVPGRMFPALSNFNPRSPWGERPGNSPAPSTRSPRFQSTLPVGGATSMM